MIFSHHLKATATNNTLTPPAAQHLNNGVELTLAYQLTQPTKTYQAIWDRVKRIRKKASDAAVEAAKSPPPPAINHTNPSPAASDITSSTSTASSSKKRRGEESVASANKTAKRDQLIESSLKSLPSYLDGKKIESVMTRRPKRSLQQVNRDDYAEKARKDYYDQRHKEQFKKATLEYEHNLKNNLAGKKGYGVRGVAAKYNKLLDSPNDTKLF